MSFFLLLLKQIYNMKKNKRKHFQIQILNIDPKVNGMNKKTYLPFRLYSPILLIIFLEIEG